MIRYGVAVLSGGLGRRIGGDKPMRLLAGRRLLDHALTRVASWSAPTVVVLRFPDQITGIAAPIVLDAPDTPGPLGGLAAALAWGRSLDLDAVLTVPCDMPFLPDDLPVRLAAALRPEQGAALAASGGRRHPVCALWRVGILETLRQRAALGQHSLHGLAEATDPAQAEWPTTPIDPFLNINTAAQLAQAEQLALLSVQR